MAYWKRYKNRIRIWDRFKKSLSVKLYRHLFLAEDAQIEAWVRSYELQYEGKLWTPDCIPPSEWLSLISEADPEQGTPAGAYLKYLRERRKLDAVTVQQHINYLRTYTFPYFTSLTPAIREFADWPAKSLGLVEHLENLKVSQSVIFRTRISTSQFWKWLRLHGKVASDLPLMPVSQPKSPTPLKVLKTPSEMTTLIAGLHPELRLLALLCYFFSLRPQEAFAFSTGDVAAGEAAAKLECCKDMVEVKLYGRLALRPRKQRRGKVMDLKKLKTEGSEAWVACFDEAAAKLFVEEVRGKTDFFPKNTKYYYDLWKAKGIPGMSLKDLRRASLYYLGHKVDGMKNFVLQKHARHKRIETTEKYLRRPDEQVMTTSLADLHLVL